MCTHGQEWECIIENFTEEEADTTVHQIYGQRAILSVNYKPGDCESARAWILKAGSGWQQAETAEDLQNMNKFAAGSLGAVTAHRIKWILSGRSAVEQMRHSPFATCGNDQCRSEDLCVLTSADLPSTSLSSSLHAPFTPSTPGSQVPGVDSCSPLHQKPAKMAEK